MTWRLLGFLRKAYEKLILGSGTQPCYCSSTEIVRVFLDENFKNKKPGKAKDL